MFVTNMEDVTHRNSIAMCWSYSQNACQDHEQCLSQSMASASNNLFREIDARRDSKLKTKQILQHWPFLRGCLSETDLPDFA